jgi:hypothetical protein
MHGETVCLYDLSPTFLARLYLFIFTVPVLDSPDLEMRKAMTHGYLTGQIEIPSKYRERIRKAILRARLDESIVTE